MPSVRYRDGDNSEQVLVSLEMVLAKRAVYERFLVVHRWFGLTAGIYFMLMGITGGFLIYSWHFESWLDPSLRRTAENSSQYDLNAIITSAAKGIGSEFMPTSFRAPDSPSLNLAVSFTKEVDGERLVRTAFVDPSSHSYRGQIDPDKTLSEFFFRFHKELFYGKTGKSIVGVLGVSLLMLLLTGLYLWWPKKRFLIKSLKWPRFRTAYQFNYEWHKLIGVYTFGLTAMIVFSGIYIAQPQWFEGTKLNAASPAVEKPFVSTNLGAFDLQRLQQELLSRGVPYRPLRLQFNAEKKIVNVRTKFADGSPRRLSYDFVGLILEETDLSKDGFDMRELQHDLHEGKYWGEFGAMLSFTAGLASIGLFISGAWIWWRRPSRRRGHRSL